MYTFNDRTVVITGGTRGLGLALAREAGRQGARVAICARNAAEIDAARQDLASRGIRVYAQVCDIRNRPEVDDFIENTRAALDDVDVLVNNAGVIQVGPFEAMTLEDFQEALEVSLYGPLYFTWATLPDMRRRDEGRIVNISSFGGLVGVPHLSPYCAGKFALTGLSESLRAELAPEGISVTNVCPWLMRTGSPRHAIFKGDAAREKAWFLAGAVMPLLTMKPERAARKILEASRRGRAQLILTPQGKFAVRMKQLFPEFTLRLLSVIDRVLPPPDGAGTERREGAEVELPPAMRGAERLNERYGRALHEYVQ